MQKEFTDVTLLFRQLAVGSPQLPEQRFKRIDYDYDLVSGKVNYVYYQKDSLDAFAHKYEYDADNRITNVYTSKDSVIWAQDAEYFYYKHGPLARVELGDDKVQGIDYAYTLQGWIKGVNSEILDPVNDIGNDADASSLYMTNNTGIHKNIAGDVFGYSLGYFTGDYQPIKTPVDNFLASKTAAAYLATNAPGLYNGNISNMVTTIVDLDPTSQTYGDPLPQLTAYRYDQLNRIKQMRAYRDITATLITNNNWNDATNDGSYESNMTYDANGNILTMNVNGNQAGSLLAMDNLEYKYDIDPVTGIKRSNKLYHVNDNPSNSGNYTTDIDDQGAFIPSPADNTGLINTANNYGYDEIGNLIRDRQEEIENISWTVYGKVKKITRTPGSTKYQIEYAYDAIGNRISKTVKPYNHLNDAGYWEITYYVRDAQGNIMATYTKNSSGFKLAEQHLYGSSRLGVLNVNTLVADLPNNNYFSRELGDKQYEMTNHLGNVNVVVSDRKIAHESATTPGTIDYYTADISSSTDYYPGGFPLPGRLFNLGSYRFGHNGQESDPEITGSWGNNYTADYWMMDSRILRRWEPDPIVKHHESPYAIFANNPIWFVDPNGIDTVEVYKESGKIKSHIETEKGEDVFFFVDKEVKEEKRGEQKTFKEGTILDIRKGEGPKGGDIYKLRGDEASTELFEWYAKNIKIEFGLFKTGEKGESGLNFLTTSHEEGKESVGIWLFKTQLKEGYTIRERIHSHLNNMPNPSGQTPEMINKVWYMPGEWGDLGVASYIEQYKKGLGITIFKIYTPKDGKYHKYDKYTGILRPVEIIGTK